MRGSKFTFSPRIDNVRYFNTTYSKSNKQSPKESGSENPDKEPDKNEEMKLFLRKLSMWFILLYVLLIALRQQMDTSNTEVSFFVDRCFAQKSLQVEDVRYYYLFVSNVCE